MAQIRSKDTKPEMIVRRYLHSKGYRYRKNVKYLPGTPDIVLRKYGVAIFIHGCFWHGHTTHMRMPKTNREVWETTLISSIACARIHPPHHSSPTPSPTKLRQSPPNPTPNTERKISHRGQILNLLIWLLHFIYSKVSFFSLINVGFLISKQ